VNNQQTNTQHGKHNDDEQIQLVRCNRGHKTLLGIFVDVLAADSEDSVNASVLVETTVVDLVSAKRLTN